MNRFSHVEPSLGPLNESHLFMIYFFTYCCIQFASTLFRIFASIFIRDIQVILFFPPIFIIPKSKISPWIKPESTPSHRFCFCANCFY